MIEIALALAVIGFALVAIIGVLPTGLSVQKDNREETLVNFDAAYLIDAIRSGAGGQDDLTNYVICITNISYAYTFNTNTGTNLSPVTPNPVISYYTRSNSVLNGINYSYSVLTNGSNIIGLMSLPKYTGLVYPPTSLGVVDPLQGGSFTSNYVSADFRSLSGPASVQGTNESAWEFAFNYRVLPEIVQDGWNMTYTRPWVDLVSTNNIPAWNFARNLQGNLAQIRLRFLWPVLPPQGRPGVGRKVFRTSAAGIITTNTFNMPGGGSFVYYLFQPRTYTPQ